MNDHLKKNGLALFWTLLSERQIVGGRFREDDYIGHVEANGAYFFHEDTVEGNLRSHFFAKGTWESQ